MFALCVTLNVWKYTAYIGFPSTFVLKAEIVLTLLSSHFQASTMNSFEDKQVTGFVKV